VSGKANRDSCWALANVAANLHTGRTFGSVQFIFVENNPLEA
jgi:hypothetical protein